jgi:hypothetical protein
MVGHFSIRFCRRNPINAEENVVLHFNTYRNIQALQALVKHGNKPYVSITCKDFPDFSSSLPLEVT